VTVETAPTRQPTAVDAIADEPTSTPPSPSPPTSRPTSASPGTTTDIDDLSPAGFAAHVALARRTLERLSEVEPTDAIDEVTIAAMRERLGLQLEIGRRPGWDRAALNNLASPVQGCRDIFDLMPTDTVEQWETIATRMGRCRRAGAARDAGREHRPRASSPRGVASRPASTSAPSSPAPTATTPTSSRVRSSRTALLSRGRSRPTCRRQRGSRGRGIPIVG
jgi:hypothetical protein